MGKRISKISKRAKSSKKKQMISKPKSIWIRRRRSRKWC